MTTTAHEDSVTRVSRQLTWRVTFRAHGALYHHLRKSAKGQVSSQSFFTQKNSRIFLEESKTQRKGERKGVVVWGEGREGERRRRRGGEGRGREKGWQG